MAKDVIMPVLGMSQDSGVLLKWLKGEGDEVTKGDILMEVETDKAVVEIEAQASGKLANISAQEGEDVPTGQVIASILEAGESPSETQSQPEAPQAQAEASETEVSGDSAPASTETPAPSTSPSASTATSQQASRNGHVKILASPKAKRLARERDINLAAVLGTGPDTVIVARDVLGYTPTETSEDVTTAPSASPAESMPVVSAVFDDLQADVDVTALLGYLERSQQHMPAATLRHLFIRFCAAVLRKYPLATAGDAVNIAVYDLEHDQPSLISDAAKKSMADIVEQTSETKGTASFALHDFTDSGVARAKRHPQAPARASLTLGHVKQNQMTLTLTYDGSIPSRDAAAFIRTLSQLIQQPDDLIFLF